jgi:hypothetical protein
MALERREGCRERYSRELKESTQRAGPHRGL